MENPHQGRGQLSLWHGHGMCCEFLWIWNTYKQKAACSLTPALPTALRVWLSACACRAAVSCWKGALSFHHFCCGRSSAPHLTHSHVQSPPRECHTIPGFVSLSFRPSAVISLQAEHAPWCNGRAGVRDSPASVQHCFHGLTVTTKEKTRVGLCTAVQ